MTHEHWFFFLDELMDRLVATIKLVCPPMAQVKNDHDHIMSHAIPRRSQVNYHKCILPFAHKALLMVTWSKRKYFIRFQSSSPHWSGLYASWCIEWGSQAILNKQSSVGSAKLSVGKAKVLECVFCYCNHLAVSVCWQLPERLKIHTLCFSHWPAL